MDTRKFGYFAWYFASLYLKFGALPGISRALPGNFGALPGILQALPGILRRVPYVRTAAAGTIYDAAAQNPLVLVVHFHHNGIALTATAANRCNTKAATAAF